MDILFVTPSLSTLWGGTTVAVLSLYRSLQKHGTCIELWSTRRDIDMIDGNLLVDPNIMFFDSYSSWRYSPSLRDTLEARIKEFDIVHIHGMWLYPHLIATRMAKSHNVLYIISPHGMVEQDALSRKGLKKRIYWSLLEQKSFENANAIHAITDNERVQISKLCPHSNSFVLPNGIETLSQNPKSNFPSEPIILFIGRIHPIKGLDRLILAVKDMPDVRLIVAGDGEDGYKSEIFALVDRLQMCGRVEFVGFVSKEQKAKLYAETSFLAVPSHSEVLSLVALEAASHGLPVLISKACHFSDIGESAAGIIIDDNEPKTIQNGIDRMLAGNLVQMSKNAFELSQRYSLDGVASRFLLEYAKNLQGK